MLPDQLALAESDRQYKVWEAKFYQMDRIVEIGKYVVSFFPGATIAEYFEPMRGSFNVALRFRFTDGYSVIIRWPNPGTSKFIEEKMNSEAAVMHYVKNNTTIPVPQLHFVGKASQSPYQLGPFLIMEYIEHYGDMASAMDHLGFGPKCMIHNDPKLAQQQLEYLFGQVAEMLLQLNKCEFDKIGSLGGVLGRNKWDVVSGPHTLDMNSLVSDSNFPRSKLPTGPFNTASSYFKSMAQMNVDHLSTQTNDAVDSEGDCRKKYVARHLFRKVAKFNGLGNAQLEKGPFKLWNEDLRPTNILLDKDFKIVGVIDWEFAYVAPAEFSLAPPWWLLIHGPTSWSRGPMDWTRNYQKQLQTFLDCMQKKERELVKRGDLPLDKILSPSMRQSWFNGDFWTMCALRKPYWFDEIWWSVLNKKFYEGNSATLDDCLRLLDPEVVKGLESFVERKMKERAERKLIDWDGKKD